MAYGIDGVPRALRGTIRSCCRRSFRAQAARPHLAFCCCPSALVWRGVPLREFLTIAERAFCLWVGLPRVRLELCRGLCCFPCKTSPAWGCSSQGPPPSPQDPTASPAGLTSVNSASWTVVQELRNRGDKLRRRKGLCQQNAVRNTFDSPIVGVSPRDVDNGQGGIKCPGSQRN